MKIFGTNHISLFSGGKQYQLEDSDPRYVEGYGLLSGGRESEFISLFNTSLEKIVEKQVDDFIVENGNLTYHHFEIKGALMNKILALKKAGLSTAPFVLFCQRLLLNPSNSAVLELFDFLSYRALPITEDGFFLAYKGVNNTYFSVNGNVKTVVLEGEVDAGGHILNSIGAKISIERNCVTDDRNNDCGPGLHAGSLDYAKGWGQRVIVIKIDPKDAVSVPLGDRCQKLRCCAYEVIADFQKEIVSPSVTIEKSEVLGKTENTIVEDVSEETRIVKRIRNYLATKAALGLDFVRVKAVRGSLSPAKISKEEAERIIKSNGYKLDSEGNVIFL
jgi:hypothetical protein